jgi:hypothetical protein
MNTLPSYTLEVRAVEERKRLQLDIQNLRARAREKLEREKAQLRRRLVVFKGLMMVSVLALVAYRAAQHFLLGRSRPGKIKLASRFG